jgi:hypothetical protein
MSTDFNERERGFEAKFRMDQELQFRIEARRDKLLGLWVAEQIGLSGAEADAYAKSVVEADLAEPGDADVVRKVLADLKAKSIALEEIILRKEMSRFLAHAREQVMGEIQSGKQSPFTGSD